MGTGIGTLPRSRALIVGLAGTVALLGGCGTSGGSAGGDTSAPASALTSPSTGAPVTIGPGTTAAAPETPAPTLAQATTTLLGTVVGGNGGGDGETEEEAEQATDALSEVVRKSDGTCAGWKGPGGGWTASVKQGAKLQVFDAPKGGHLLATGSLGAGKSEDVNGNGQWQCDLKFSIEKVPQAAKYFVKVGSLPLVEARPDSSGAMVVPVSTPQSADRITECQDVQPPETQPTGTESTGTQSTGTQPTDTQSTATQSTDTQPAQLQASDPVGEWQSFGEYWSQGLPNICGAGLRVDKIEGVCRPKDIATDRIVAVVDADSEKVLEDAGGLQVDPASLDVGTAVDVRVTTAYPC